MRTRLARIGFALSLLLAAWLAPAGDGVPTDANASRPLAITAPSAELGDAPVRTATALELLRELDTRIPRPRTDGPAGDEVVGPRSGTAQTTDRADRRTAPRFGGARRRCRSLPHLPTGPPHAG